MAPYPAKNTTEASELLIDVSNQLHEIVNESATSEISTDSGLVPSVRKALADTFLFQQPIPWEQGQTETAFNQLRTFGANLYWAPSATSSNPISMGATPEGDDNWPLAPTRIDKSSILSGLGKVNKGYWDENPTLENSNEFVVYRNTGGCFGAITTPYPVDSVVHPDPNTLVPSELYDVSKFATEGWTYGRVELSVGSFEQIKKQEVNPSSVIKTAGYYLTGDGGGDTYIAYNKNDIVPEYDVTAETLLNDDCAGVLEMDNSLIAVRQYNVNIDVRQMGFKPCKTTYSSDRLGWIPETGAFDNAPLFQKYDNLIDKMTANITTFSGTFAVGFTGFSKTAGDGNTCCRYSANNGKLIGLVRPAMIALPFSDAMVIRTPISSDPDYTDKIDQLELDNFVVCGNWSQQTWAGPTGLEDPSDNPLSGWVSGKKVYDQNGFGTYAIKRLITKNSGALYTGQDGMPSGSVDYFHHTNLLCKWTGKGSNSNFNLGDGTCIDPEHSYSNSAPSDDKPIYTLSSDGYSGVGCQNIDETAEVSGL